MFPLGISTRVVVVPPVAFSSPENTPISRIFYITILWCVILIIRPIPSTGMLLLRVNLDLTSLTTFDIIFRILAKAPERVFQVVGINLTQTCILLDN
jgi:hypothetical protein